VADTIMLRVAADENLHMMFYRDIVAAALQVDPSATIEAITEEVLGFAMPGSGHPGLHRQGAADGPGRDL
jgi:acyl-[acyl-carrier-protein] desaturase